jgi:hypothetical protein
VSSRFVCGRRPFPRTRAGVLAVVAAAALATPAAASAHPRTPAVALDARLRLTSVPSGVRAHVIDGDRELRLTLVAPARLVVLGLLGEPFLRFGSDGVWVNRASPSAAADRLVPQAGSGWERVASSRSFAWHDHRLAPPGGLRGGETAAWSLPVRVDGRPALLRGTFVCAAPPASLLWLAVLLAGVAASVLAARRWKQSRPLVAGLLAAVASLASLAATAGFAGADPLSRRPLELACTALLALAALAALFRWTGEVRAWVAMLVGAVAVALSLGYVSVFWHGVVISTLPATLVRVFVALGVCCGFGAAVFGLLGSADEQSPRRTSRLAGAAR